MAKHNTIKDIMQRLYNFQIDLFATAPCTIVYSSLVLEFKNKTSHIIDRKNFQNLMIKRKCSMIDNDDSSKFLSDNNNISNIFLPMFK